MSAQSQARECALTGPRVRTRDPESAHSFSDPSTGICVRVSSSPQKRCRQTIDFGLSALLLMHRPMAGDVDETKSISCLVFMKKRESVVPCSDGTKSISCLVLRCDAYVGLRHKSAQVDECIAHSS